MRATENQDEANAEIISCCEAMVGDRRCIAECHDPSAQISGAGETGISEAILRFGGDTDSRELIDLARHFAGAEGIGANHDTDDGETISRLTTIDLEPESVERWNGFHQQVEILPDEQRAVVDLLWYEGMSQSEAAKVLEISLATLKRRWQAARLELSDQIKSQWID